MNANPNSVRTGSGRETYHHGALRETLIQVAEALIDERGLEGFGLREATRRAGVSPGSAAHHFGDTRGLLTAVAAAAFKRFGEALKAAEAANQDADLRDRLKAQAIAYLRFALEEGEKFKLMWRVDLIDRDSTEYSDSVRLATSVLFRARRGGGQADATEALNLDSRGRVAKLKDPALAPAVAVWTLVHGFAELAVDGVFGHEGDGTGPSPEEMLGDLIDRLVV